MVSNLTVNDTTGVVTIHMSGFKRLLAMKATVSFNVKDIKSMHITRDGLVHDFHKLVRVHKVAPMVGNTYLGGEMVDTSTTPHSSEFWDANSTMPALIINLENKCTSKYSRIVLGLRDPAPVKLELSSLKRKLTIGE